MCVVGELLDLGLGAADVVFGDLAVLAELVELWLASRRMLRTATRASSA